MAIPAGAQTTPTRATIQSGTCHDVMYFKVLAFCEAVFWRSEFATRCWFTALSVVMGQCWLSVRLFFLAVSIRDAMLVYRTLSGNGSVLAFCEAVFWRSAFATPCWFTALAVVMGQCWLSVRLFFWRSAFATPCWFTALSVVMGQCWLSVRLFFGGQHSRRDVGLPHSQW